MQAYCFKCKKKGGDDGYLWDKVDSGITVEVI